jgi:hypothetical protein
VKRALQSINKFNIAVLFAIAAVLILSFLLLYLLNTQHSPASVKSTAKEPSWAHPSTGAPEDQTIPCLTSYTIFNGQVYYGTIRIAEANVPTFLALPTSNCISYGKDKKHAYIGAMGLGYEVIPQADPTSFTPFYDAGGLILYSKDRAVVYETAYDAYAEAMSDHYIQQVPGANAGTFTPLYDTGGYFTGYAKDDRQVYYLLSPISGADPHNFIVLRGIHGVLFTGAPGYFDRGFAEGKTNVYYGSIVIDGADPRSFTPLNTANGFWTMYAKDKNGVYCETPGTDAISLLKLADPASFTPEQDSTGAWTGYAHDQTHRWQKCTLLH